MKKIIKKMNIRDTFQVFRFSFFKITPNKQNNSKNLQNAWTKAETLNSNKL